MKELVTGDCQGNSSLHLHGLAQKTICDETDTPEGSVQNKNSSVRLRTESEYIDKDPVIGNEETTEKNHTENQRTW